MSTVSGEVALAHRLCLRLTTKRGRFPWWPNFGTDMAQFLNSKATPAQIARAAQLECIKDEQVLDCAVDPEIRDNGNQLLLHITIATTSGPFKFSLLISQARTELISLQAA
jgi:hypothetical protein